MIEIRRLASTEVHEHLDGLAGVLFDCVAGGASVSYMAPFSHEQARSAFEAVAVTGDAAERLYERLGWTRVGVIPGYALYPDGRPCDTTVFWKSL